MSDSVIGKKWKAVINGKRALNGKRYGATFQGTVESVIGDRASIYDVMIELAYRLEEDNREMKLPDSFQVTLFLKES